MIALEQARQYMESLGLTEAVEVLDSRLDLIGVKGHDPLPPQGRKGFAINSISINIICWGFLMTNLFLDSFAYLYGRGRGVPGKRLGTLRITMTAVFFLGSAKI